MFIVLILKFGIISLENIFIRVENAHNLYSNNFTTRYLSKKNVCTKPLRDTYNNFQSSIVCSDPILGTFKFLLTIEWINHDINTEQNTK